MTCYVAVFQGDLYLRANSFNSFQGFCCRTLPYRGLGGDFGAEELIGFLIRLTVVTVRGWITKGYSVKKIRDELKKRVA